jgi:hypothetical protein
MDGENTSAAVGQAKFDHECPKSGAYQTTDFARVFNPASGCGSVNRRILFAEWTATA